MGKSKLSNNSNITYGFYISCTIMVILCAIIHSYLYVSWEHNYAMLKVKANLNDADFLLNDLIYPPTTSLITPAANVDLPLSSSLYLFENYSSASLLFSPYQRMVNDSRQSVGTCSMMFAKRFRNLFNQSSAFVLNSIANHNFSALIPYLTVLLQSSKYFHLHKTVDDFMLLGLSHPSREHLAQVENVIESDYYALVYSMRFWEDEIKKSHMELESSDKYLKQIPSPKESDSSVIKEEKKILTDMSVTPSTTTTEMSVEHLTNNKKNIYEGREKISEFPETLTNVNPVQKRENKQPRGMILTVADNEINKNKEINKPEANGVKGYKESPDEKNLEQSANEEINKKKTKTIKKTGSLAEVIGLEANINENLDKKEKGSSKKPKLDPHYRSSALTLAPSTVVDFIGNGNVFTLEELRNYLYFQSVKKLLGETNWEMLREYFESLEEDAKNRGVRNAQKRSGDPNYVDFGRGDHGKKKNDNNRLDDDLKHYSEIFVGDNNNVYNVEGNKGSKSKNGKKETDVNWVMVDKKMVKEQKIEKGRERNKDVYGEKDNKKNDDKILSYPFHGSDFPSLSPSATSHTSSSSHSSPYSPSTLSSTSSSTTSPITTHTSKNHRSTITTFTDIPIIDNTNTISVEDDEVGPKTRIRRGKKQGQQRKFNPQQSKHIGNSQESVMKMDGILNKQEIEDDSSVMKYGYDNYDDVYFDTKESVKEKKKKIEKKEVLEDDVEDYDSEKTEEEGMENERKKNIEQIRRNGDYYIPSLFRDPFDEIVPSP
jgi:hypothetical protein